MKNHIRTARSDELEVLIEIDDDATRLYAQSGLTLDFDAKHPYLQDESKRWRASIEAGFAYVLVDPGDRPLGFITLGFLDAQPYLDQLSVRSTEMRRGVGAQLLGQAIRFSQGRSLWLTTYSHLSWNRPYYEKHGFVAVDESQWGPELRGVIDKQRQVLPSPEERIVMVRHPVPL